MTVKFQNGQDNFHLCWISNDLITLDLMYLDQYPFLRKISESDRVLIVLLLNYRFGHVPTFALGDYWYGMACNVLGTIEEVGIHKVLHMLSFNQPIDGGT